MKIFSIEQIKEADSFTITHEPITSIDLMERASLHFVDELLQIIPEGYEFHIFCGKGNNGGDGLAISRILAKRKKKVYTYIIQQASKASEDFNANLKKLQDTVSPLIALQIIEIIEFSNISIPENAIVIDGIFGSGLNKPIQGISEDIISYLNSLPNFRVAIDIPSGMFADYPTNSDDCIFKAHYTITFQYPKLMFMFAENEQYTGNWNIVDIGLAKQFEEKTQSHNYYTLIHDIRLHSRGDFSHKGTFGHALLVAGSIGKMGAAILASRSCLKSGCGLVTTHIPHHGNVILQTAQPEIMTSIDADENIITEIPIHSKYSGIGIGPGIGTDSQTIDALLLFLKENNSYLVLDADALNILSLHKELISLLPPNTILTPHPGEFDRLTKPHTTGYQRMQTQIKFSQETRCIVVLKGKYTSISLPNGNILFNSSGNPGMATAGSGDVLTGIILSFLAQGFTPTIAAQYAVFIHGLAGDIALQQETLETLTAQTIIENLRFAFMQIKKNNNSISK